MARTTETCHEQHEETEALFLNLMGPDATPEDWDRHEYLTKTSAEHRRVFAECERVWQGLDQIGAARLTRGDLLEIIRIGKVANADTLTVVQVDHPARDSGLAGPALAEAARRNSGGRQRYWAFAALALLTFVVGGFGVRSLMNGVPEVLSYTTLTGEHEEIELPDGSSLVLGARSSVTVRYTSTERLIELGSGELLATVSPDYRRPFILVTDDMMVMATGTAFNTRNGSEYSTVSVVEGSVRVIPRQGKQSLVQQQLASAAPAADAFDAGTPLHHGQQLRAATNAELGPVKEVDIEQVLSWQSGQLYFLEDDLPTVFQEVMRYSDVTFQLTDSRLRERMYTGSFRPDSLDAWLNAIERAYSLKVTRISADRIAVAPADQP